MISDYNIDFADLLSSSVHPDQKSLICGVLRTACSNLQIFLLFPGEILPQDLSWIWSPVYEISWFYQIHFYVAIF